MKHLTKPFAAILTVCAAMFLVSCVQEDNDSVSNSETFDVSFKVEEGSTTNTTHITFYDAQKEGSYYYVYAETENSAPKVSEDYVLYTRVKSSDKVIVAGRYYLGENINLVTALSKAGIENPEVGQSYTLYFFLRPQGSGSFTKGLKYEMTYKAIEAPVNLKVVDGSYINSVMFKFLKGNKLPFAAYYYLYAGTTNNASDAKFVDSGSVEGILDELTPYRLDFSNISLSLIDILKKAGVESPAFQEYTLYFFLRAGNESWDGTGEPPAGTSEFSNAFGCKVTYKKPYTPVITGIGKAASSDDDMTISLDYNAEGFSNKVKWYYVYYKSAGESYPDTTNDSSDVAFADCALLSTHNANNRDIRTTYTLDVDMPSDVKSGAYYIFVKGATESWSGRGDEPAGVSDMCQTGYKFRYTR